MNNRAIARIRRARAAQARFTRHAVEAELTVDGRSSAYTSIIQHISIVQVNHSFLHARFTTFTQISGTIVQHSYYSSAGPLELDRSRTFSGFAARQRCTTPYQSSKNVCHSDQSPNTFASVLIRRNKYHSNLAYCRDRKHLLRLLCRSYSHHHGA